MDCTYKTNRYGLPLLDIVGFASTGQTFHLAFAFMKDERQDTYEITLQCLAEAYDSLNLVHPRTILTDKERALINAISVVFPDTRTISCIWHIQMNLLKKARPLLSDQVAIARRDNLPLPYGLGFELDQPHHPPIQLNRPRTRDETQDELRKIVDNGWKKMLQRFNRVVYADSEDAFAKQWDSFQEAYKDPVFQPIIQYIQSEWLDDCPEQFLHLYTAHYLHLGETATSRTEAAHWLLKSDLYTSTNDLLVILRNFERVVNRQYTNINQNIEAEQVRRPIKLPSLYDHLVFQISSRAMRHVDKIIKQYLPQGADEKPPIPSYCNCRSKETAGFPCIHLIIQYIDENKSFEPSHFHQQWHLWPPGKAPNINPLLLVQDPLLVRRRGRPRGAANFVRPSQASSQQSTQQSTRESRQNITFNQSTQREPSAFEPQVRPAPRRRSTRHLGRRQGQSDGPGRDGQGGDEGGDEGGRRR